MQSLAREKILFKALPIVGPHEIGIRKPQLEL